MFLLNFILRFWILYICECYFCSVSLEIMFFLRKFLDKFIEYFELLWIRIFVRILEILFLIWIDLYKFFWGFIVNCKYGFYLMDKIVFMYYFLVSDFLF